MRDRGPSGMALDVLIDGAIDAHLDALAAVCFDDHPIATRGRTRDLLGLPAARAEHRRIAREHYDHAWADATGHPLPALHDWHAPAAVDAIEAAFAAASPSQSSRRPFPPMARSLSYQAFLDELGERVRSWFGFEWNALGGPAYR